MTGVRKTALIAVFIACFFINGALADQASLEEAVRQLQKRIEVLEKKVAEQDKCLTAKNIEDQAQEKKIAEYEAKLSKFEVEFHRAPAITAQIAEGLELGAGLTMIVQGTNNVNNASSDASKKKNRTDGSYSADITLSKEFKDIRGRAFLHLEGGQGDRLEDDLTLFSNVNRDADEHENVRVTELWYEQGLFKDKAVVTFGKLDPTAYFDVNAVACNETTQFLNRMFRNSPTLEFPDNTAGFRAAYIPTGWFELGYGLFNGNSDSWSKMFDNLFNIGQIRFQAHFFDLPGNYRFYGWNNNLYHTKWQDTSKNKEAAYGFGLSFDQKLNDIITAFCRYGWQDPSVYNPDLTTIAGDMPYSLEQSWSTGLQIAGKPWGREKDMLGFAVGQDFASGDYKKSGASLDPARRARQEGHLETYYRIQVNEHLALSPDFQYIWNPFGKDVSEDTNGIFVGGMRAQLDF